MPHAHSPATHAWPLAQVVPHAPQFKVSLVVLRQLPSQHMLPAVLHDLPSVLAPPQLTHAPDTQTSSLFGQSADTVHAHTPLVQLFPAAQGEQPLVPAPQVFSSAPQVHAPSSQVVPFPHEVPHAPQCSALVSGSTHPPEQHDRPLAHRPPEVPASPHARHAPATQTSPAPGQSADVEQPQVELAQLLPGAHGVQPGVPGAQSSALAPQVQSPAAQVLPAAQVVPQPPQLLVLVEVFTQLAPQQVLPALQVPPEVPPPPHATH